MLFRPTKSIAILGGGIAGLVAAWRLSGMGHRVRLFEQTGRLGGTVRTEMTGGWLIESGPNSLAEDTIAVNLLSNELKLMGDRVEAPESANQRFLVRGGRLVPLPRSPGAFLASPLLSPASRLRALLGDQLRRPNNSSADHSFARLIRRHFGNQALDRIVQPVVSGIYAGDPEKLSARYAFPRLWDLDQRFGSLMRGQRILGESNETRGELPHPKIISFRRGLQTLYHALVLQLPAGVISINARVEVIRPGPPHWSVFWRELHNGNGNPAADGAPAPELQGEPFDLVLSTLPPLALAKIEIAPKRDRPMAGLAAMEHAPVASLFLGFRREDVTHPLDGFGFLAPAQERRKVLGVVFSSSMFPDRAPPGHVALTVMAGGTLQPDLARLPAAELIAAVLPDLRALLGVRGEPVFTRHHFWPQAIPQYNLGHGKHLDAIAACERENPGLLIGGQAVDGVSLPNAVRAGERLAQRVGLMSLKGAKAMTS